LNWIRKQVMSQATTTTTKRISLSLVASPHNQSNNPFIPTMSSNKPMKVELSFHASKLKNVERGRGACCR
jgi:hypothetical protein